MDFVEIIKRARNILKSEGRITYRTLKRQFKLDDEALEDLKFELIEGQELAVDKDGKMLVWTGEQAVVSSQQLVDPPSLSPNPRHPSLPLATPLSIWRTVFVRWRSRMASARRSPRSLPISKGQRR